MAITPVQRFMLFSLGKWLQEANKKIKNKHLEVAISKSLFIDVVKTAQFADKKERALYKNLETLEDKKLIIYNNKHLSLTKKGQEAYKKINKELKPYINVITKLKNKSPTAYTKKVQTILR